MHKGNLWSTLKGIKKITISFVLVLSMLLWSSFTLSTGPIPIKDLSLIETTDHVIVVRNNTVIFDYLEQEDSQSPVQLRVIEKPKFGVVSLNEDNTFEYSPTPDLCEEEDQFTYQMTIGHQLTNVVVSIEILCESITIYSGIVSNKAEEKKLEHFKILGVENFPENSLHIFDNSGREIYEIESYQNDWEGQLAESENLADEAMYYYVFKDGTGNYFSGYLRQN